MGSKQSGSQTQTQTVTPDPITDQWRNTVFNMGSNLIGQGGGVAPLPQATLQSFNSTMNGANQIGASAERANGALQNLATGGGANPYTDAVGQAGAVRNAGQVQPMINQATQSNPWTGLVAGAGMGSNPFTSQISMAGFTPTTAGVNTLQDASSGGAMNPYLDSLYSTASKPVMDDVNATFAKAGRFGANAAYGNGMTKALGNLSASIYAPAYEAERGRQLSSATTLAGLQQNDLNRGLNAAQSNAGIYGDDANRRLSALSTAGGMSSEDSNRMLSGAGLWGGLLNTDAQRGLDAATTQASLFNQDRNAQLQATSQMPAIWNGLLQPGQQQQAIGQQYQQQQQAEMDAPWNYLSQFANMMNGMPTFGTTSTTGNSTANKTGLQLGFGPNGFNFGLG